jgi:hypothetical protein
MRAQHTSTETSEARKFFGALYHVGGAASRGQFLRKFGSLQIYARERREFIKNTFRLDHAYRQIHFASYA